MLRGLEHGATDRSPWNWSNDGVALVIRGWERGWPVRIIEFFGWRSTPEVNAVGDGWIATEGSRIEAAVLIAIVGIQVAVLNNRHLHTQPIRLR